jgi:hypothetical protein
MAWMKFKITQCQNYTLKFFGLFSLFNMHGLCTQVCLDMWFLIKSDTSRFPSSIWIDWLLLNLSNRCSGWCVLGLVAAYCGKIFSFKKKKLSCLVLCMLSLNYWIERRVEQSLPLKLPCFLTKHAGLLAQIERYLWTTCFAILAFTYPCDYL